MKSIIVFGGGMVGSAMALDLAPRYRVTVADLYAQAGLPVPHGAKPRHDISGIATWLSGLDQAGLDDVQRRCGVRMEAIVPPSHGRNSKTVG